MNKTDCIPSHQLNKVIYVFYKNRHLSPLNFLLSFKNLYNKQSTGIQLFQSIIYHWILSWFDCITHTLSFLKACIYCHAKIKHMYLSPTTQLKEMNLCKEGTERRKWQMREKG